ncbi:MAG: hypothetical protein GY841_14495 [FCB group bacterium]|nr:hypothetical protein [FCB group bacterium]
MSATRLQVLFTSVLIILVVGSVFAADDPDRFDLTLVDSRMDIADFFVVDIDGDGEDEFLELFGNGRGYKARSFNRERILSPALYQANSEYSITSIRPVDIDTLPGVEIAVALKDDSGDSIWIEIAAGPSPKQILCRTEAIHGINISDRGSDVHPNWDGYISACRFADLDQDGTLEIIVPLKVSFDLYPRGIYVYSYPSGKLLWYFPTAGIPLSLRFGDANRDDYLELYFRTRASFNGAEVNGRSDTAAYVYALSHSGDMIWDMPLGVRFDWPTGNVAVCDCDRDDTLEIYYNVLLRGEKYDRQVRILEKHRAEDNQYLQQRSFDADHDYRQILVLDMDSDGMEELVINDRPSILNPADLSTIKEGKYRLTNIIKPVDIDAIPDGLPEVILKKNDSLYILDNDLNLLASYGSERGGHINRAKFFRTPFGDRVIGALVDINGDNVPGNMLYLLKISSADKKSSMYSLLAASRIFWPTVIIAFMLGMPVGIVLYRMVSSRTIRRKLKKEPYVDLLGALTTFNHGQTGGKNLNRLSFLFANLPAQSERLEAIKPNMEAAVESYKSFTSAQLDNIVRQARKLKSIKPLMIGLSRQVIRLDDDLEKTKISELIIDSEPAFHSSIPTVIDEIQKNIGRLRKHLQSNLTVDLAEIVPRVLVAVGGQMRQEGIGFQEIITRGGGRFRVYFLEMEIMSVLEELFVNSFAAMTDLPTKKLSMYIEIVADEVEFRLSDTGCGFREENLSQVFSREYSTKKDGGGYGLYHVREQIERFGGRVRVGNNVNGPGATVQLNMKLVSDDGK